MKATLLLEAAADIQAVERDLREMELLKKREVERAGRLEGAQSCPRGGSVLTCCEDLLPLKPQLRETVTATETLKADMNQSQDEVARLLARYNNYVSAAKPRSVAILTVLRHRQRRICSWTSTPG